MSDFKLRVVLATHIVKKIVLSEKPSNLQELYNKLSEKVDGMPEQFLLMYEDPEFDNSLVSLDNINDLKNFASVTVVQTGESLEVEVVEDSSPVSLRTVSAWPETFVIPQFDVNVEMQLQQAQDGFHVPWALKRDILHKLAITIHAIKAYPSGAEIASVAKALVAKHPCLYEKGTINGWSGWKNSLTFKMGNFRTGKLGCTEVAVNARKRSKHSSVELPPAAKNVKKPKRNEVNFLPNVPVGTDEESIELLRVSLRDNCHSRPMNASQLASDMIATFAVRRQEIVCEKPPISVVLDRWLALFLPSQVCYNCV